MRNPFVDFRMGRKEAKAGYQGATRRHRLCRSDFEGDVLTRIDDRADYGEVRFISMGMVDAEYFIVVHTERAGLTA
jgi:hypothetical protein